MELGGNIMSPENIKESEEGIEVKIFLHTLKRLYHVNESVGTYVCSKMKNFMNNYRHKTKRIIFEGLRANKIISSKVNDIIDTALKESNFEKVFESLSDLYYCNEFNKTIGNPAVCKVQPQKNQLNSLPCPEVQPSVSVVPTVSGENSTESLETPYAGEASEKCVSEDEENTKRVLVENGNETCVVYLKDFNTITNLKGNLVEALNVGKDELKSSDIKYFSKGLKKWTVLRSWKSLKADETIKICPRKTESQDQSFSELEEPLSIEPQDPPPLLYQKDENLELPIPLEQKIEEVIKEYKSGGGEKTWVFTFQLPVFEEKFVTQMEKGEITSRERIKICQTVQQCVALHDKNPSTKEIALILKVLFLTYPKLAEMDKDYWVTWNIWRVSLSEAFAKSRKKEESKSASTTKTKSVKRKARSLLSPSKEPKKKVANSSRPSSSSSSLPQPNEIDPLATPEEEVTMEVPVDERSRTVGPMERLSPAMALTFEERRRQVVDEGWSIRDILISYPWLHNENEIFAEFSRIVDMDKPVDRAMEAGFRKIVYALLHSLRSHVKYRTVLEKEKELRKDTDHKGGLRDFEYKMALFALPFAFGEDIEDIFKPEGSVYEEPIQIEFSGSNRYEDGKSFAVIIEDAKVECSSLKRAVAVFVSSFFIFNLAYPSDIKKFLYFIERNLLGIPGKVPPPSQVSKLVKKIDEFFDGTEEA